MSYRIYRVPLDFDHPLDEGWPGFLMPDRFAETPCPDCKDGYSPHAQYLRDLWYGYRPFNPSSTGSTPWQPDSPVIREFAQRTILQSRNRHTHERAIVREAQRLAARFNSRWSCHLSQDDVNALVAAERLYTFTHTWSEEGGWQAIEPPVVPTAAQVNEWSIYGIGHDVINAGIVIRARCEREGVDVLCPTCQGEASIEAYPGQRAEADAWEPTDPPKGEGWQLWETISEGSPISPVFSTADQLAVWMSQPARGVDWVPRDAAAAFIAAGWAPSGVSVAGTPGFVSGIEFIGTAAHSKDKSESEDR
jgi:hypothetical protein